ncbi:MAG: metallophosphoesterase [Myxococcota bacterium]
MRIATVSDLHTDFAENRSAVVKLAVAIHAGSADVVVVAGDVSHKDERIDRALRAFSEVTAQVAYIPGNHDLWYDVPLAASRSDLNTWRRHDVELRAICEGAGAHYLPESPLIMGRTALVGSCGWYDYSLMAPAFREQFDDAALALKTLDGLMWSDARFIAFRDEGGHLMPDPAIARQMEDRFIEQLTQMDANDEVDSVVAVTHHQPFYEVVSRTGQMPWEYFCAFMGSKGLGEAIRNCRKAKYAVYGHSHIPGRLDMDGLVTYGTPLGYPRERRGLTDEQLTETRIGWIELD